MLIAVQFGIMSDCWLASVAPVAECPIFVGWGLFVVTDCWLVVV